MGRRSKFADGYPQSARARSRPRQSELGQIPASHSNATLVRRICVRSTINFACHPERSEGPHEASRITKSNLCNQSPKVRSLVVCATQDDIRLFVSDIPTSP